MKIVLCVRDSAARLFGQPFFVQATAAGVRALRDEVNGSNEGDIKRHPEDFELYQLGSFDDDKGVLLPLEGAPTLVCRAKDLRDSV